MIATCPKRHCILHALPYWMCLYCKGAPVSRELEPPFMSFNGSDLRNAICGSGPGSMMSRLAPISSIETSIIALMRLLGLLKSFPPCIVGTYPHPNGNTHRIHSYSCATDGENGKYCASTGERERQLHLGLSTAIRIVSIQYLS